MKTKEQFLEETTLRMKKWLKNDDPEIVDLLRDTLELAWLSGEVSAVNDMGDKFKVIHTKPEELMPEGDKSHEDRLEREMHNPTDTDDDSDSKPVEWTESDKHPRNIIQD